ncbi:LCP family protein [Gordonia sp. CPCC 205333]|uniref:LCP family protein n=1 Tax=Gordonia sp. CPCC 205333 TaxID=3140790 RepID=UPI003AF35BCE
MDSRSPRTPDQRRAKPPTPEERAVRRGAEDRGGAPRPNRGQQTRDGQARRPIDAERKPRRPRPDGDRQRPQRIPNDGEVRRSSGEIHTREQNDPRRPKARAKRPAQARPDAPKTGAAKPKSPRTEGPRDSRPGRSNSAGAKARAKDPAALDKSRPKRPNSAPAGPPPPDGGPSSTLLAAIPPRGRLAGRFAVALLSAVVLLVCGYAWNSVRGLEGGITQLAGLDLGTGDDGAVDILLVGTDSRTDAKGNPLSAKELRWLRTGDDVSTSTDTIILIRIPNNGSSATAVSIPRDAYVNVPGLGKSKINAAYGATREHVRRTEVEAGKDAKQAETDGTQAGRKALVQTVADLTGVQVDHYAEVGLLGFALLTDAVGGVDVCLKAPVREPLSGARFKAGRQTLTGGKALSFVRQRHDLPRGDLDRITRQQVFMASLAQKILSTQTLTDSGQLSKLQNAVSRSVVIDDNWDILKFAEQLKDLSGGNVKFSTVPVVTEQGWSDDGTQSVVKVDPAEVKKFTEKLLSSGSSSSKSKDFDRGDYTVDVVNAGTIDGLAGNVGNILSSKGFQTGKTSTSSANDRDSVVYTHSKGKASQALAADLGNIAVREDSSLPENTMRVVLTNTFEGPGSIADTGPTSDASKAAADAKPKAAAPISAGTNGPMCVN